ncbi:TonB-dependent receptor [Luteimonas sp. RD2P54]|uniref:TonB-dependent receptor n=1 Tax=Luteimonas endophytica TaxID=3042023 RepID=A0ABT6J932_9GAMM|nr:TonB-dependent receptor [Luteimonas endophytica]MDH5823264.1 TonB-dependent receptor [Luteimonas endophytica]
MQSNHPRTALSRALGLAILAMAGAPALAQSDAAAAAEAQAQQQRTQESQQAPEPQQTQEPADVTELDSVVVTGFRRSLQFSTDAKRDSTGFTDSIFAEDIGKFPDLNIAESLNRIPGIQLARDVNNEGLNVAIRGLPSSFTKTVINGVSVATASIGLDATNQNREVDLNLFPTEFFTAVTVHKTPRASLPEGGAAGVVDMRSLRPFDNPGTNFSYQLQGEYNDISDEISPRGTFTGSWTNDQGTFGATVGVSSVRGTIGVEGFETIGWTNPGLNYVQCGIEAPPGTDPFTGRPAECNSGGGGGWLMPDRVPDHAAAIAAGLTPGQVVDRELLLELNPDLTIEQISEALMPRLGRPVHMSGDRDRDAFMASFELRPSDNVHLYMDTLYTKAHRTNDRLDVNLVGRVFGASGLLPIDMQMDENDVVTEATFTNAQFFLEARPYQEDVQYWSVNPGGTFWFGADGDIKLDVQANRSRSWMFRESPTILVNTPFTTIDYRNDGGLPEWDTELDLNDPALGWTWAGGRVNVQNEKRVTETTGARADLQFGEDGRNVRVGAAYDRFSRRIQGFDNSPAWQAHVLDTISDADLASYLLPGPHGFITVDFDRFMNDTDYARFRDEAPESAGPNTGGSTGGIAEKSLAAYVEVNGETEVLDRMLRFNAGMRYVTTDQEVSGPVVFGGVREWQVLEGDYKEWLPSFSAAWDVADDVVLRMSGSRTMTRPNPSSMLPNTTFTDQSALNANQGNPNLAPYLSTNFDIGGEWYTGDEGFVGATLFNKRVTGYTYQGITTMPFAQLGVPWEDLTDGQRAAIEARGGPDNATVNVQQQVNADGSLDIRGLELIWVQPLPFVFEGLGFMANFTKINLDTEGSDADRLAGNVFGIAPKMWNSTVYWENDLASVRLSYNWTEGAAGTGPNQQGIPYAQIFGEDRGQYDLSASYTLANLPTSPQLTLNVLNITGEERRSNFHWPNAVNNFYDPGRTILLGIRGTF